VTYLRALEVIFDDLGSKCICDQHVALVLGESASIGKPEACLEDRCLFCDRAVLKKTPTHFGL
jgi:hypothetical protein